MLGYILAVCNVLNADCKTKKRSDGFELLFLNKIYKFLDNNGQSFLQYVCKKMTDDDPSFPDQLRRVNKNLDP